MLACIQDHFQQCIRNHYKRSLLVIVVTFVAYVSRFGKFCIGREAPILPSIDHGGCCPKPFYTASQALRTRPYAGYTVSGVASQPLSAAEPQTGRKKDRKTRCVSRCAHSSFALLSPSLALLGHRRREPARGCLEACAIAWRCWEQSDGVSFLPHTD